MLELEALLEVEVVLKVPYLVSFFFSCLSQEPHCPTIGWAFFFPQFMLFLFLSFLNQFFILYICSIEQLRIK